MIRNTDKFDIDTYENTRFYTEYAETYVDYDGCLPADDDTADYIRVPRVIATVS